MKKSIRTFVAIETGAAIRDRAEELIGTLAAAAADVKWVERHNLHITLKFLGDVPLGEIARVCEAVSRAAEDVTPFELELRGAGAFPNAGRPRTVWLGAPEGSEPMRSLHKEVESRLQKLGFRKDGRRFETHLTLGRVRSGGPVMAELGRLIRLNDGFEAGRMTVSELVVFSSTLTSTGPIYEPLARAALGSPRKT